MLSEFKSVLSRAQGTLLQDAAGVVSLAVLLVVTLYLPGF